MGHTTPLISILMPVYNAARYLRPALASLQQQSFGDFELIAVDDGSSDNSKALLEQAARTDPRVRVISRPNTGIVGALNDALAQARASLIARMDADDLALPDRLARQLEFSRRHPDCIAFGTAVQIIDSRGAVVDRYIPPLTHEAIEKKLLIGDGGAIIHPTAFFRLEALKAAGGYDPAFCKAEDLDLFLRLSRIGKLGNLPELGLRYRHHAKSTNFKHRDTQLKLVSQILARERPLRGLPALESKPVGHSDLSAGQIHANWACTALIHGTRLTAVRHACCSILHAPRSPHSWRTLRYVLTASPSTTSSKA